MTPSRRGLLFVLSSPSGAGKSTLSRRLLEAESGIVMSVSATTRAPRPGEEDGREYHFVSGATFDATATGGGFLEWAHVFGNRYGTPAAPVRALISQGSDVLFDIDWQGTQQLSQSAPNDVVRVFILPPSMAELERRLRARAADSDVVIAARMARAADEISHWPEYDYVLINTDVDRCLSDVRAILTAERLKRARATGLVRFARDLVERMA